VATDRRGLARPAYVLGKRMSSDGDRGTGAVVFRWVEDGDRDGAEPAVDAFPDERPVQLTQRLARPVDVGDGPKRVPCEPGEGGSLQTLATDVADERHPASVVQLEHVVEVAADGVAGDRRQEQRCDLDPRDLRDLRGQQARLERGGRAGPIAIEAGALLRRGPP